MKRRHFFGYAALLAVGVAAACARPTPPPTADLPPLRLAITDVSGMEGLERDYGEFRLALATALGTEVEFFPVENYTSATVALKSGDVDLVVAGPSEYVVINARTNAVPVIAITRLNYRSVIAVPAGSDLTEGVAALKGKKIAMSDIGSTSGHLGPTALLLDAGLDPQLDVVVEMLGDDGSAAAMKAGSVDAWGGSVTDFEEMLKDDAGSFVVLIESPPLPSDVILASSSVDLAAVELIRERLLANQEELVTAIATHETKYAGSTLKPASDTDYNSIRAVYQAIGQGEFVQ
ncbi:MAG TPA: PhnD/SsuA/transferrin family substrate-binding protein [Candidatus Obscuribacterales bacterium]